MAPKSCRLVYRLFAATLLTLIVLGPVLFPTLASAEEPEDTPLEARTKELIRQYNKTKEADELADLRTQLLAKADSLEAAESLVLASHCLERAGMVSYQFAQYDEAGLEFDRGYELAKRSGDDKRISALLNGRAVIMSAKGDNEGAIALQLQLLKRRQKLGDIRGEGVTWHNLAFSYLALFEFPEAIDALEHAMTLHREAGNVYGLATSMHSLAGALFRMDQQRDAMVMADSAVAAATRLAVPMIYGLAVSGRGVQHQANGRHDLALQDFALAQEAFEHGNVVRNLAVNRVNRAISLIALGDCSTALGEVQQAWPVLESAGQESDRVTARAVQAQALVECGQRDEGRAIYVATIDSLNAMRQSLETDVARAEAFESGGWAYAELAELQSEDGDNVAAWISIENATATVQRAQLGLPLDATAENLSDLQRRLRDVRGVLLQYAFSSGDEGKLLIVTPTTVRFRTYPIEPEFAGAISRTLGLLASGAGDEQCRPMLERLSRVLLTPVVESIEGADRIVIVPGPYAGVPFDALPIPTKVTTAETALGERYPITYAPAATIYLAMADREPAPGHFLILADPINHVPAGEPGDAPVVAMRSRSLAPVPLPEARREAEAIATGSATVLIGDDARKESFLESADNASVVHFATHALVDGGHPDNSLILLAGNDPKTAELSAGEIGALHMNADLVSLSGCSTAGGYIVTGEGALGLSSAFFRAGARSVVASRWDVEDGAARRFMELFYGELENGTERDRALQVARHAMAVEGYPHRDRSAFFISGAAAAPVAALTVASGPGERGFNVVWVSLGLVVVLVVVAGLRRRRSASG